MIDTKKNKLGGLVKILVIVTSITFALEILLELFYPPLGVHNPWTPLRGIYYIRLLHFSFIWIGISYARRSGYRLFNSIIERHEGKKLETSRKNLLTIRNRIDSILNNHLLNFFIIVVGFLVYFLSIHFYFSSFMWHAQISINNFIVRLPPVPIINSVWAATGFFTCCIAARMLVLLFRLRISPESVDPLNFDRLGGYKRVIDKLTFLTALTIIGLGLSVLALYYFIEFIQITILLVCFAVSILLAYSIVIYNLHQSFVKAKEKSLEKYQKKIEKMENELFQALDGGKTTEAFQISIALNYTTATSYSPYSRLRESKTWPISIPNLGKISISTLLSIMLPLIKELLIP